MEIVSFTFKDLFWDSTEVDKSKRHIDRLIKQGWSLEMMDERSRTAQLLKNGKRRGSVKEEKFTL
jgi:hypothetical protein